MVTKTGWSVLFLTGNIECYDIGFIDLGLIVLSVLSPLTQKFQ